MEKTTAQQAILVVSFGTSHNDTRVKTIDVIEKTIQDAYPSHRIYRAWTSNMIIEKVLKRDNVKNLTVREAVQRMVQEGIKNVYVQPTHVMNGIENDLMIRELYAFKNQFDEIHIGAPLLTSSEDALKVIHTLMSEFHTLTKSEALILMGHGTAHYANSVYAALDYMFKDYGYTNVYVGTVEAYPSLSSIMRQLDMQKPKHIYLAPFMIVAGDHAKHDMASNEPDSWYSQLHAQGYVVSNVLKGLGEYKGIRDIFLTHIEEAQKIAR